VRHAIVGIGVLLTFTVTPQIASAALTPFATANATCNGFNTVTFPLVNSSHGDVVYFLSLRRPAPSRPTAGDVSSFVWHGTN
jgi:hypothetical protein